MTRISANVFTVEGLIDVYMRRAPGVMMMVVGLMEAMIDVSGLYILPLNWPVVPL